jgi:hypothetical protein
MPPNGSADSRVTLILEYPKREPNTRTLNIFEQVFDITRRLGAMRLGKTKGASALFSVELRRVAR